MMFNNQSSSYVMELLSNPKASLISLVDNDYFISEFKASSNDVQQHMNYKRFEELISYVTQVGQEFDRRRSFKLPYVACELLCCESALVFEKLIPDGGIIIEEEKTIMPIEQEIQQQIQDDDEQQKQEQQKNDQNEIQQKDTNQQTQKDCKQLQKPGNFEQVSEQGKNQLNQIENIDDQQFGQFVEAPAKKKKIIKLKQVVDQIVITKVQYQPLILKLFGFFSKSINYTLAGYVCKILTTVLNKRTNQFFNKLFQSQQTIQHLLKCIESRSVVDLIIRICTIQNKEFLSQRFNLYKKLIQKLPFHDQVEVLSNISAGLCEVYDKINSHLKVALPYFELKIYIQRIPELLQILVPNLLSAQRQIVIYSTPIIYEMLNSFSNEPNQEAIESLMINLLDGILLNIFRIIDSSSPRIGISGVKLIQILNLISKNKEIQSKIIQKPILFNNLIKIIKLYPSNNILHNEIFKLFNNLLVINTNNFVNNVLEDQQVMSWLQAEVNDELTRIKNNQKQTKKCYLGHIINLCVKLRDLSEASDNIRAILQKERYINIMMIVNDHYLKKNNNNLAGYSKNRTKLHRIMFTKAEILNSYTTFLNNAQPPVFKIDQDDPLSNPALLEQLQKQLDGISNQNQNLSKEQIQEEQHKKQLIELNEQNPSGFWKYHLDYDPDELLKELL